MTDQSNPYAPPQAEVRDTVASTEAELAGRGTRLGAAMLDGLIFLLALVPLFASGSFSELVRGDSLSSISPVAGAVSCLALIGLVVATVILVKNNGQTLGKKITGIKVIRSDGSPASLGRIFWLRNVVNALPGVVPFVGNVYTLVDNLFIFNEKRQCVHDKIADTIVVKA